MAEHVYVTLENLQRFLTNLITLLPTKVSELENDSEFISVDTSTTLIQSHNTSTTSHSDIRNLISTLSTRLNALADSDDETLDQLSEIVAYIKSNKDLIDAITTSKVSVDDIVNDLTTSDASKVLSAEQGVALKSLIDELEAALETVHVQADLNVNDETDPRYVHGRTHWIGDPELVTIIEETTIEINDSSWEEVTLESEFVVGQNHLVNWNGTEYECIAWNDEYGLIFLGNGNLCGNPDKGEDVPFIFLDNFVYATEVGTYTFSVTAIAREYYPIDERFLPPVIGRPGTNVNAEVFNNYSKNIASGGNSHAEGNYTIASGYGSHAEGDCTVAFGTDSHAEGCGIRSILVMTGDAGSTNYTLSSTEPDIPNIGDFLLLHDVGALIIDYNSTTKIITLNKTLDAYNALANTAVQWYKGGIVTGDYSHVEGCGNIAMGDYQHVQGKYNADGADGKYAHIVGNGTEYARSNAHTIDWEGNAWFAGGLKVGGTGQDDTNAVEVATKNEIIPLPSTATVGQTIVVKSVDENGVPTKWETVDLPEQVQPDWNQHYETAPDYIKNRTHWIEVNDDIFFEGDVLKDNNYYGSCTLLKPLVLGESYTVVYDGVTYENLEVIYVPQEGFGPPYGEAEYWYLGNTIELGFRLAWYEENATDVSLEHLYSEAESHSLRVFQSHDVVHQLNSKYLPSEEWIFTLEDGSTVTKKVVLG